LRGSDAVAVSNAATALPLGSQAPIAAAATGAAAIASMALASRNAARSSRRERGTHTHTAAPIGGFGLSIVSVGMPRGGGGGGGGSCSRPEPRTRCRGLQTGLVGLPNVGKSTLFNALTQSGKAEAANFPFCTIEPNVARAKVPDSRLDELAAMAKSEKIVPEMIEYVDIAGLIKGASNGEGLGNKFLANIRNTDAIVHVVRCFEDDDVIHVDGSVDPVRDVDTIQLELVFADLEQCEKRMVRVEKDARGKVKGAEQEKSALTKIIALLQDGKPARLAELDEKEAAAVKSLGLLSKKPILYAANVSEEDLSGGNAMVEKLREFAAETNDQVVVVSAQVEEELNSLEPDERADYLESLGVAESGTDTLARETYKLLGLRTYFTCGPQETHAWTIRQGWTAPQAAGVIHTDFEEGFIKAETIYYADLLEAGSEEDAKSKGKMRIEGKDYVVQEGDVMHFRFRS